MSSSGDKELLVAGFGPSYFGTDHDLLVLNGASTRAGLHETWVGYFMPETEDVFYALQEVMQYLYEIKTQRWSMSKINGQWVMAQLPGPQPTYPRFNQGDMVVLKHIYHGDNANDEYFRWHTRPQLTNAKYEHPQTTYFEFEEQLDYIPFYVSISDDMKNYCGGELGLYINDLCYGAEVVHGDTIQINAYILESDFDDDALVEFRYYEYNSRLQEKKIMNYLVYDIENDIYQIKNLNLSQKEPFYLISFVEGDKIPFYDIPLRSILHSNYPNPFNPSTAISFNLSEEGPVKIDIYNIRGEHIKTLINEIKNPGTHSVIWDGVDVNGKNMSSGIYFYKMETNHLTETKKMLLIK